MFSTKHLESWLVEVTQRAISKTYRDDALAQFLPIPFVESFIKKDELDLAEHVLSVSNNYGPAT
jgi:hypothetical protein